MVAIDEDKIKNSRPILPDALPLPDQLVDESSIAPRFTMQIIVVNIAGGSKKALDHFETMRKVDSVQSPQLITRTIETAVPNIWIHRNHMGIPSCRRIEDPTSRKADKAANLQNFSRPVAAQEAPENKSIREIYFASKRFLDRLLSAISRKVAPDEPRQFLFQLPIVSIAPECTEGMEKGVMHEQSSPVEQRRDGVNAGQRLPLS